MLQLLVVVIYVVLHPVNDHVLLISKSEQSDGYEIMSSHVWRKFHYQLS